LETEELSPTSAESIKVLTGSFLQEVIASRHTKGVSQKKLQAACGVQQTVIARLELGETDPQLSTIMKVLYSLGMTLSVVPLYTKHNGSL